MMALLDTDCYECFSILKKMISLEYNVCPECFTKLNMMVLLEYRLLLMLHLTKKDDITRIQIVIMNASPH